MTHYNNEEFEQIPIVTNKPVPNDLVIGDYVFASRWSDCDPCDPWHVGFVTEIGVGYIVCGAETPRRWLKAMRITKEQGARICAEYPILEKKYAPLDYKLIAEIFGIEK
jgi:hypothetical protein